MMKKIIKTLEYCNAWCKILIMKILPKHKINNRVLINADLGIGDLVMFMPVIKILIDYNYDVSFYVTRQVDKEILSKHFPHCQQHISGKYGWSLQNFHGQSYKKYFNKLIWLRIPNRVGHVRIGNKWNKFFNKGIKMIDNNGYQVDKNMDLIYPFISTDIPIVEPLFFKTEQVLGLPKKYFAVAPFCWSDPTKKVDLTNIIKGSGLPVVLLGSKEELKESIEYCKQFNNVINYTGQLNIFQTAYVIKNAQHFYTHEGGLGHIAAAIVANVNIYYYPESCRRTDIFHKELKYINYIPEYELKTENNITKKAV